MTDAPMLQQSKDDSPQVGGDRRPMNCPDCGDFMLRDLFGQSVCLRCAAALTKLKALQESGVCPRCGSKDLSAWSGFSEPDRLCLIWCVDCENHACVGVTDLRLAVDPWGRHWHRDYILWTWIPVDHHLDDVESALLNWALSEVRDWRNAIGGRVRVAE